MKQIVKPSLLGVTILAALAFGQSAFAGQNSAAGKGYAEAIYSDFTAASANTVSFQVRTLASGQMSRLAGRTFSQLTGEPAYRLAFEETRAIGIASPRFSAATAQTDRTELDGGVEEFDVVGLPVRQGRYRLLAITAQTGGESREHRALEFCWDARSHCVVYDPQIEFLDSVVNNYRSARADGYGPIIQEQKPVVSDQITTMAVCRLASNRNIVGRSSSWGARTITYKNVYTITVVEKYMGAQQVGITCTASCAPAMYGYSYLSSAWTNIGFSADCANKHVTGTTGGKGTAVSESKCTHQAIGGANADVSVNGSGASIGLSWNLSGSVDSTGGALTDTCGWF